MLQHNPIIDIAQSSSLSVVSVIATKNLPSVDGFYPMAMDGKRFFIPKFKKGQRKEVDVGGGSGFIVHKSGIVLTNSHVVEDPKAEYTAILNNSSKKTMEVLARDPIHDIAICRLERGKYAALTLGDSSSLKLGEYVLAVGNALGEFSNTISLGIISGLSRFIQAQGKNSATERLRGLIQTDAAINPGNSGGPLINMDGHVVGINTATIAGAQSIGFSIPIDKAKEDLRQIKEYGRIRVPFLGIHYIILDEQSAKENKLPVSYGALITRQRLGEKAILRGSSAQKAGLREMDIILEADNKKITPEFTIQDVLQEKNIGDKISIKIWRAGKEKMTQIELEEKSVKSR